MSFIDDWVARLRESAPYADQEEDLTFVQELEQISAGLEPLLTVASGVPAGLLGAGAGLGQLLREPTRPDVARNYGRDVMDRFTYKPRTNLGQEINEVTAEATGALLEPVGQAAAYVDEKAREQGYGDLLDYGAVTLSPLLAVAPPKRAVGNLNYRNLTKDKATALARRGKHLKRDKSGQYVGAPRGVDSPGSLRKMRSDFDKVLTSDEYAGVGADWYDRAKMGIRQVTGGDRKKADLFSDESALWSAQADPGTNLGFQLRAHNEWEGGGALDPDSPVRTWQQTDEYARARYLDDRVHLGPKTGMYQQHLNPNAPPVTVGVNDIWHARNFGYTNKDGGTFSRGLSDQEHAFMDAETILAADRANKNAVGGRTDWSSGGVQAAPWVLSKGRSLAGPGGRTEAEGIALANRSPAEYMHGFTAHGTYERVPGVGTGHVESLVTAPWDVRKRYSDAPGAEWTDDSQRDILYDAMGAYARPTNEATGYFQPAGGAPETNPAYVARPLVEMVKGEGGGQIGPAGSALLDIGEATRGYLDVQNMGARHKFVPAGKGATAGSVNAGAANALRLPLNRSLSESEMLEVQRIAGKHGFSPSDTGDGVTLFDESQWGDSPRDGKAIAEVWKNKTFQRELNEAVPGAGNLERGRVDANAIDYEGDWQKPGSGAATSRLLDTLDSSEYQGFVEKLGNDDRVKAKALQLLERDESFAKELGDVTRADVQNARRVIAKSGGNWVEALRKAMKSGAVLPAVGVPLLYSLQQPAGDEEQPPGPALL
jgi:hypothetical protein